MKLRLVHHGRKPIRMEDILIKSEWVKEAHQKSTDMGLINNSITRGAGNMAGFLGEIMVMNSLPRGCINNTYEYDIEFDDLRIDVKTKRTSVKPKDYYECSVSNPKQKCSHYIFTRILNDYSKGWILGAMPKKDYFKQATFLKKGDPNGDNGFIVKADCYNMIIRDLKPINELFS